MTTTEPSTELQLDIVTKPPTVPKIKKASPDERARIAGHASAFVVPFGSIRLAENIRLDDTDVTDLAEDIRRRGLLQPIPVRPYGVDDNDEPVFVVEAGHRRYNALRALKLEVDDLVPVHPVSEVDGLDRTLRQWAENMQRQALTPIDEAHTIRTLTTLHELKIGEAAEQLGIDRNTASRRLLLLNLPEPIQHRVAGGEWEIEAAQLVGRLIRDGAPTQLTDGLAAMACTRTRAQAAVDEFTAKREHDRLVENLRARGMVVVSDAKNGPAPDGHRTELGADLDAGSVAAVKRLDVDALDTVTDADGKPVVWVARSAVDGKLRTYSLRLRELPSTTAEIDDGEQPLSHRAKEAGKAAMTTLRLRRLTEWLAGDYTGNGDVDPWTIQRAALHIIVSRAHTIDVPALGRMIGAEPVMASESRVDLEATAAAWFEQLTDDQTGLGIMLIVLMYGIAQLGYQDGTSALDNNRPRTLADLAVDIAGIEDHLLETEFRKVALHAAAKLDELQS